MKQPPSRKSFSLKRKGFKRKAQKRPAKGRKKKDAPKSVSKLQKELDAIFSRYKRISVADQNGIVECYTCGHKNHYKKMQNGHYISRFYKKYRFDERNTRVQCPVCNMWKSGDIPTFRAKLVKELGEAEILSMESDYKELTKYPAEFYQDKIQHYQQLLTELS